MATYTTDESALKSDDVRRAVHGNRTYLEGKIRTVTVLVIVSLVLSILNSSALIFALPAVVGQQQTVVVEQQSSPVVEAKVPTSAQTVTAEPKEDFWASIRPCALTAISVARYQGDLAGLDEFLRSIGQPDTDIEQYRAYYDRFEVWQDLVLHHTDSPYDKLSGTDRWGNVKPLPTQKVESLEEISSNYEGMEFKAYNRNGFVGYGEVGLHVNLDRDAKFTCSYDYVKEVKWTPTLDLKEIAVSEVTIQAGIWTGGFIDKIYVGREISQAEFNHLFNRARHGDGSRWAGIGYVGGGNSSWGNYDVTGDATLYWENYGDNTPDWDRGYTLTPTHDIVKLPLMREIVVFSVDFWDDRVRSFSEQRLILWQYSPDAPIQMLEPADAVYGPNVDTHFTSMLDAIREEWLRHHVNMIGTIR